VAVDLDPAQITARIGLLPTRTYVRGDLVSARLEIRHTDGYWSKSIDNVLPENFSAELAQLLSMLPDNFSEILSSAHAESDVFVGLFGIRDQSTFWIGKDAHQLLSKHGLDIIFDMYIGDREES